MYTTSTTGWAGVDIFFVSYSGSGSFLHSALIKEPFKTNPQGLKWDSRSWHPSSFQNATLPYFFEYEIIFYLLAFIYIMNKNSGKRNFVIALPEITYPLLSISGLALHEKFLWKDKSSPRYDCKNNFFCLRP